jgi:hypothetical protein
MNKLEAGRGSRKRLRIGRLCSCKQRLEEEAGSRMALSKQEEEARSSKWVEVARPCRSSRTMSKQQDHVEAAGPRRMKKTLSKQERARSRGRNLQTRRRQ